MRKRNPGYAGFTQRAMQDAAAYCEALVRTGDRDRFLATLFAPAQHRAGLFALYAFNLEIARIRGAARAAMAGEIRLQWWRDVLVGQAGGTVEASPIAAALLAAVAQYALDLNLFQGLLDARRFDLYEEPMSTLADLETYADAAAGNLIALATQVLLGRRASELDEIARHAARAQAIAGLLAAFAIHSGQGQLYVPLNLLQRHGAGRQGVSGDRATAALRAGLAEMRSVARQHLRRACELLASVPAEAVPAFLPVALAGPTLARMDRGGYDPFTPVLIAPWRRQWLLWRAARDPRRIFLS